MVLCPEGATGLSPGLGFSIFDIFAPTRESEDEDELEYEYDWGTSERLGGRRNERSSTRFSSKSLPRTSSSFFNRPRPRPRPRPLLLPARARIYNKLS